MPAQAAAGAISEADCDGTVAAWLANRRQPPSAAARRDTTLYLAMRHMITVDGSHVDPLPVAAWREPWCFTVADARVRST